APQAAIYPLNLEGATQQDYQDLANTLENEFGQLNGILHSAAWLGALTPLENYDAETWFKVMQVNLNGPVQLTQACLPLMHQSDTPSMLFTLDDKNRAYWGAYGVSKQALSGLVKVWADELENDTPSGKRRRIRVNGINPGPTRTNLRTKAYPGELPSELPTPEEKMAHYLYLIGNDSQQISGEIIRL
ncbi:MAG: SDR family oxidoreductase, partial [Gammaproteobacteria bacterium]|nr:SDR family oxidoreductase [Gammaproteobacteria bacterium]